MLILQVGDYLPTILRFPSLKQCVFVSTMCPYALPIYPIDQFRFDGLILKCYNPHIIRHLQYKIALCKQV